MAQSFGYRSLAERRIRRDDDDLKVLLAAILSPSSNCVDIGAHEGVVLKDFVRLAPEGHHIAFEPLPDFAARLRQGFPTCDVRALALSNHSGSSSFVWVKSDPGWSGLRKRAYPKDFETEEIEVQLATLDEALPADYMPDVIKIDVEGAEQEVIEGAIKTITKFQPVVLFEHGAGAAEYYGSGSDEIHDLLCADAGLRIFDNDGNGPFSREEFEDLFDTPVWNSFARR